MRSEEKSQEEWESEVRMQQKHISKTASKRGVLANKQ